MLHVYVPPVPFAVSVAVCPSQSSSGHVGVTVGAAGLFRVVTTTASLVGELPQVFDSMTV